MALKGNNLYAFFKYRTDANLFPVVFPEVAQNFNSVNCSFGMKSVEDRKFQTGDYILIYQLPEALHEILKETTKNGQFLRWITGETYRVEAMPKEKK